MRWRLVDSDLVPPPFSAAADEAIALARSRGFVPDTLHFYRRDRPTVSLGYFQRVGRDLNLAYCERENVFVLRRASGGSAIFTDPGHLIYALIVGESVLPRDKVLAYELVCGALVRGLAILGVEAEFKPVNDVLVSGMKISGSAQMRRWGVLLQHGTLVMENDEAAMKGALRQKKELRVTSLAEVLDGSPGPQRVKDALVRGFSETFNVTFDAQELTEFEKETVDRLVREKYGTREWNYRR